MEFEAMRWERSMAGAAGRVQRTGISVPPRDFVKGNSLPTSSFLSFYTYMKTRAFSDMQVVSFYQFRSFCIVDF